MLTTHGLDPDCEVGPFEPTREPSNNPLAAVNSISFGSPHACPMWALSTRGEPSEIEKIPAENVNITALFKDTCVESRMVMFLTHPEVSEPMLTPWPFRKSFCSASTFCVEMLTIRPLQSRPALDGQTQKKTGKGKEEVI